MKCSDGPAFRFELLGIHDLKTQVLHHLNQSKPTFCNLNPTYNVGSRTDLWVVYESDLLVRKKEKKVGSK